METKICNKCGIEKNIDEFELRKDTGKYRNECKECKKNYLKKYYQDNRERLIELDKKRYEKNKDKILEYHKIYDLEHKDIIKEKKKKYYEDNKEFFLKKQKEYRENHLEQVKASKQTLKYRTWKKEYRKRYKEEHPEKIKEATQYFLQRLKNDPIFKLKHQTRNLIKDSFKRRKHYKVDKAEEILGCNIDDFIKYLLTTFKNNYGYEWDGNEKVHIDHIIPLSTAKTESEVYKLCHYTNLQLLKAKDNLEKHDNLDWNLKEELK